MKWMFQTWQDQNMEHSSIATRSVAFIRRPLQLWRSLHLFHAEDPTISALHGDVSNNGGILQGQNWDILIPKTLGKSYPVLCSGKPQPVLSTLRHQNSYRICCMLGLMEGLIPPDSMVFLNELDHHDPPSMIRTPELMGGVPSSKPLVIK